MLSLRYKLNKDDPLYIEDLQGNILAKILFKRDGCQVQLVIDDPGNLIYRRSKHYEGEQFPVDPNRES